MVAPGVRPGVRPRSVVRPAGSAMVGAVFWPLIGGFIALVIVTVLIGWIVDRPPSGNTDEHY